MKIQEVIDCLLSRHPRFPEDYAGCDAFKCGDPEAECTGIAVALAPTVRVIERTKELGANLLIVHEPTFYESADDGVWHQKFSNSVYEDKKRMLDEAGIAVWRDHDHMHATEPDDIFYGLMVLLGWADHAVPETDTGLFGHYLVTLPREMTLRELCGHLCGSIGLNGARVIGDPDMKVRRVAQVGHIFPMGGGNEDPWYEYSVRVIKDLEEEDVDVILPGETIDWTVLSYIRDSNQLGRPRGMIQLGHFNLEELGMKYLSGLLPGLIRNELPVTYVPCEDMYNYYVR